MLNNYIPYLEDQEISGRCGFSPNRKVLLAVEGGQLILCRMIGFLKCIEIGFVLPVEIFYYFIHMYDIHSSLFFPYLEVKQPSFLNTMPLISIWAGGQYTHCIT